MAFSDAWVKALEIVLKSAFPFFLALTGTIFVPDGVAQRIGIQGLRLQFAGLLGGAWLLTLAFSVTGFCAWLWRSLAPWFAARLTARRALLARRAVLERLRSHRDILTTPEWLILIVLLQDDNQSVEAYVAHPGLNGLVRRQFADPSVMVNQVTVFKIRDDVWQVLHEMLPGLTASMEAQNPHLSTDLMTTRRSLQPPSWMAS